MLLKAKSGRWPFPHDAKSPSGHLRVCHRKAAAAQRFQTYLSSGNFAPLHSTAGKPFSLPRYTWRPFAILKGLGLSVATYDENLGPAGSDLDRYDLPRYHRDPRASHRRHR